MLAIGEDEFEIVVHVAEGGRHLLIAEGPVAVGVIEIGTTILQPEADRFALAGADEVGVGVTAADVGEGADGGEDLAELVWTLPGDGEGADAAAAGTADRALVWVAGQSLDGADFGENFVEEEARVLIAEGIVFEASIGDSPRALGCGCSGVVTWIDEDADGGWHVTLVDELVKDGWHAPGSGGLHVVVPVLEDHDSHGFFGVGVGWKVEPPIAGGAGEDLAEVRFHLADGAGGDLTVGERSAGPG